MRRRGVSGGGYGDAGNVVPTSGCTLLEMLLATAILVVAAVLVAQILDSASGITRSGISKMNLDAQARMVFDRMSLDFKAGLRRVDIDYWFQKEPGNDQWVFYSQASGFYPSGVTGLKPRSPVSVVGYRIANNHLERYAKALVWNGVTNSTPSTSNLTEADSAMVFSPVTIQEQWAQAGSGSGTDPCFQVLSPNVFRMEFCFQTRTAAFSELFDPNGSSAVVVTLALAGARKTNVDLSQLARNLADGKDPGVADRWVDAMTANHEGTEIRVYQRVFQLGVWP